MKRLDLHRITRFSLQCFILGGVLISCSAKFLKVEEEGKLAKIEEYEEVVQVKTIKETKKPSKSKATEEPVVVKGTDKKKVYVQKEVAPKKEEVPKKLPTKKVVKRRLPEIESSVGFDGRRPINDPFRVGEKVVLDIKYFNIKAGQMTVETLPFKEVNGNKAYHFRVSVKSAESFNWIYSVEDVAETFLDYEKMIPYNFAIHVKESKQLKEVRCYFDWEQMKGHYWHKKVTKDKGERTKKFEWNIEPYSQNAFSAPFYFRAFKLVPGETIRFPMAHEKKNMIVDAKVLRREVLKTKLGEIKTLVIQPKVKIGGIFKPMGDVLFWVTDDDRKFVVKLKSKIKIGSIIGELADLDPGQ